MPDILTISLAGFTIGLMGSMHCIGMCGPIALALPVHGGPRSTRWIRIGLYNMGRAATYAMLGLIFGFVGSQFRIWGLQQILSVGAGMLILFLLISRYSFSSRIPWLASLQKTVEGKVSRWLAAPKRTTSYFMIGIWNGLLPCGLVYVGIAAALTTSNVWHGTLLMFSFGLGTLPVMAALMIFGQFISPGVRHKLNRAVPYLIACMALILILRGLNLGIPYVSPKMDRGADQIENCHAPS